MADLTKYRPADLTTRKPKHDAGSEIDAFVQRSRAMQAATRPQRGRLIFALDATQSRQPTWDMACQLQAEMFQEVSNLDVQLVFYRGLGECMPSGWVSSGERLADLMSGIICRAGETQIGKILAHARSEIGKNKVEALVFVGDAIEENLDELAAAAAELGRLGLKVFMFQEGDDPEVESAFRQIAQRTHGAYCRFDAGAPRQLAELLRAVAAYAAGGIKALEATPGAARLLTFFDRGSQNP
jgi:hypothetical protein